MKLQGAVVDEYERLIEENPKQFKKGEDVLKAVEDFAFKAYKKLVTVDGAMSYNQWWKEFKKANEYMLDKTVFSKTNESFIPGSKKPVYKPNELEHVWNVLSEYDIEDIKDFIDSPDIESKENFILDNDIQTLRVCYNCGKFINEGYLYKDFETYCSDECFIEAHDQESFNEADEDTLYWTAWEG